MAFHSDMCYLPKQENEFIHKIFEDLEILLQRNAQNRATSEDDCDKGGRRYEQPLGLVSGIQFWKDNHYPSPRTIQMNSRDKREPDKAVFIPRPLWEMDSATRAVSSLSVSEESCSDTTEESLAANQDAQSDDSDHVTRELNAFVNPDSSGLEHWPPSWDHSVSYFKAMSWDYAPGDARDNTALPVPAPRMHEEYISEITTHLKEQDVVILSARNDYSCYENTRVDAEAFGHILEIYNISSMFRTDDLVDAFGGFSAKGLEIHWVDGRHALAVFSSKAAALQALSIKHPLIRARKLSCGTKRSKGKALRLAGYVTYNPEMFEVSEHVSMAGFNPYALLELLRPENKQMQTDPKVSTALDLR